MKITLTEVRQALALPADTFDALAAQLHMAPQPRPLRPDEGRLTPPRLAGVLLLLYPSEGELHFALMRRAEYEGVHSGQISLPGGKHEAGETFEQTALREACEEVGACDAIELLGALTPLYVPPSDFEIHPIVGYTPSTPAWVLDPIEVAQVIEVPLSVLFDATLKRSEDMMRGTMPFQIKYYAIGIHKVWGATAIILSEFESRLRAILASSEN